MAKGYKVHAIIDSDGAVASWRVAPMNLDERVMAQRLLRTAPIQGYLVADPIMTPTSSIMFVGLATSCNW
jgi:hypothetical protein